MRVVHVPTEIAGQMGILCHGLRQAGIETNGYNWFHSYLNYKEHVISTDAYELKKMVDPLVQYCDVFHFHNGNTMLLKKVDLPLIVGSGRKAVMQHWGNDVRTVSKERKINPYPIPPSYLSDQQIHRSLTFLSTYIADCIVQDYELFPHVQDYYEKVHVLPLACDTKKFIPAYPGKQVKEPLIIHAPTNRAFKGSDDIDKAIAGLKGKVPFQYLIIEKMKHAQALQAYQAGDIIIDQIRCGTYGMLSVEAMAMGKVVVAFIRDDVRRHLPEDLPIVNANRDTLAEKLETLIRNPELRHQLGKKSRQFVEKYHRVDRVVQQLIQIYQQL